MATRSDRSGIEVEAISQIRGQDEIEKGKVGEGIFRDFFERVEP
jgi:hypothetical protein